MTHPGSENDPRLAGSSKTKPSVATFRSIRRNICCEISDRSVGAAATSGANFGRPATRSDVRACVDLLRHDASLTPHRVGWRSGNNRRRLAAAHGAVRTQRISFTTVPPGPSVGGVRRTRSSQSKVKGRVCTVPDQFGKRLPSIR